MCRHDHKSAVFSATFHITAFYTTVPPLEASVADTFVCRCIKTVFLLLLIDGTHRCLSRVAVAYTCIYTYRTHTSHISDLYDRSLRFYLVLGAFTIAIKSSGRAIKTSTTLSIGPMPRLLSNSISYQSTFSLTNTLSTVTVGMTHYRAWLSYCISITLTRARCHTQYLHTHFPARYRTE